MAAPAQSDTELLTEHFGYPPVSLLDDIINSVNILAERALNSVEQALLRQPPASLGFKPAAFQRRGGGGGGDPAGGPLSAAASSLEEAAAEAHRHEVENGTHQLETLLCASIDRNFDKFELYVMRNILCVRPEDRDWMRLAHYEGLDLEAAAAEGGGGGGGGGGGADANNNSAATGDAEIAHLHRRLQASLQLGRLLDVEAQRNEALLARLRTATGAGDSAAGRVKAEADGGEKGAPASLAFLLDRGPLTESDAAAPLTTTTAFALSQLPALRQLSDALRHKAPGLAAAAAAAGVDPDDEADDGEDTRGDAADGKSWRRERLEYIEGAARRHLVRVRGLDLGRSGETRSSETTTAAAAAAASSSSSSADNQPAVEPEALTHILGILRESHGGRKGTAGDAEPGAADEAMDES